ncbi:unnamed protein product [Rhizophagus irregularis]|nr:unnamed protein product [Rhizophagus irregularis]
MQHFAKAKNFVISRSPGVSPTLSLSENLTHTSQETYSCLSRTARVNRSAVNKNCLLENKSVYGFDVVERFFIPRDVAVVRVN